MKAVPGQTELPQLQKLQRGEWQPADDAVVTIQSPTENTLSQQRGFAFTRTQYKSMPVLFFINCCLLSFFLLENISSKFLLHLSFISYIDIYLIYCMSQVGEEASLSILANREELNEKTLLFFRSNLLPAPSQALIPGGDTLIPITLLQTFL